MLPTVHTVKRNSVNRENEKLRNQAESCQRKRAYIKRRTANRFPISKNLKKRNDAYISQNTSSMNAATRQPGLNRIRELISENKNGAIISTIHSYDMLDMKYVMNHRDSNNYSHKTSCWGKNRQKKEIKWRLLISKDQSPEKWTANQIKLLIGPHMRRPITNQTIKPKGFKSHREQTLESVEDWPLTKASINFKLHSEPAITKWVRYCKKPERLK